MVKFFGAFSKNILFTPEGFSEDPCSTCACTCTCISFGIVVSLASMYWAWYRRARYITIRGKGQSAKRLLLRFLECILIVLRMCLTRQRVSTDAIHPRYMDAHEMLRYKKYVVNTKEYMTIQGTSSGGIMPRLAGYRDYDRE